MLFLAMRWWKAFRRPTFELIRPRISRISYGSHLSLFQTRFALSEALILLFLVPGLRWRSRPAHQGWYGIRGRFLKGLCRLCPIYVQLRRTRQHPRARLTSFHSTKVQLDKRARGQGGLRYSSFISRHWRGASAKSRRSLWQSSTALMMSPTPKPKLISSRALRLRPGFGDVRGGYRFRLTPIVA